MKKFLTGLALYDIQHLGSLLGGKGWTKAKREPIRRLGNLKLDELWQFLQNPLGNWPQNLPAGSRGSRGSLKFEEFKLSFFPQNLTIRAIRASRLADVVASSLRSFAGIAPQAHLLQRRMAWPMAPSEGGGDFG